MGREAGLSPVPFGPLRVLDGLVRLGMAGAGELAETLGVTPAAVRSHLNSLLRRGLVEVAFRRSGAAGPRERVWRATASGLSQARPHRFPYLLTAFLHAMRERLGMEGLAELLGEAARQLARAHPPPSGASLPQRLQHLRELLDTLGVATCYEEKEGAHELCLVSSLLPREFSRYPEMYVFHRALTEEILGVPVELTTDARQEVCVLRFREPQARATRT